MLATLAPFFLIAVAAAGLAYALLYPILTGQARSENRRKALNLTAETMRPVRGVATGPVRSKRDQVAQSLKEVEQRHKANGKPTLEERFTQAGLKIDRKTYVITSALCGLVMAGLAMIMVGKTWAALPGLIVGALGMPGWYLNFCKAQRIKKFLIELPNALDVITRGLKSGLPLNDCVRMIAAEAAEPIKSEFRAMIDAQAVGLSLGEAIDDLYRRIPVAEANYLGIIIAIQQRSGGNLAESLGNMSKVVRERRKLRSKIQSLSAEAKTSAGIIAAMPVSVAGLVYLSTPSYIEKLWLTQAGQFTLVGCGIWMLMGVLIMRKMINFQV
ncbi:MAG: type II secretion system F family protein [Bosea sp. (in: a-proteobacteria)]